MGKMKTAFAGVAAASISLGVAGGAAAQEATVQPVNTETVAHQNEEAAVILKYGQNIDPEKVEFAVLSLTYIGVPAQAVAGGSVANCIELEVKGQTIGLYTAEDLERKIGSTALRAFREKELTSRHTGNCIGD